MTQITLPKLNQTGTNEWADVEDNDVAIRDVVNGNLDNGNLSGSAGITDANLASPNSGLYKVLFQAQGFIATDAGADTYLLGSQYGGLTMVDSGTAINPAVDGTARPPTIFRFNPDDYNIAGKTEGLEIIAAVAANATAPAINFTFGLYPVTVAGGADTIAYTAGTVVSGSTCAINTPSASIISSNFTPDITPPSLGNYMLAVATSGTIANNSAVSCHAQLMIRST